MQTNLFCAYSRHKKWLKMDRVELIDLAEQILEAHKENLLIDPFIRIKIEVAEGEFTSQCIPDKSPMAWIIQLNPERHRDFYDIQYSILEALFVILFDDFKLVTDKASMKEIQKRVIARVTTAFCEVFSDNDEDVEEDYDEED